MARLNSGILYQGPTTGEVRAHEEKLKRQEEERRAAAQEWVRPSISKGPSESMRAWRPAGLSQAPARDAARPPAEREADAYRTWTQDYNQLADQYWKDSEARSGVWQDPTAFKSYREAMEPVLLSLQERADKSRYYYNTHRYVYGNDQVKKILEQIDRGREGLKHISDSLRAESEFRGKFLNQEEFDTYNRLSWASTEELTAWNEELAREKEDLRHHKLGSREETKQELERIQQTQNLVLKRYYELDNEQQFAQMGSDPAAKALYQTAALADSDMDLKVSWMLDHLASGGSPEDDRDVMWEIGRKLNITPEGSGSRGQYIKDLTGALKNLSYDQEDAIAALAGMGYDYERLSGYQQAQRDAERYGREQEQIKKMAQEHPFLSSAATWLVSPFQAIEAVDMAARGIRQGNPDDIDSYVPLNVYNMGATNYVSGTRGAVAEKIEADTKGMELFGVNVPAFLYQTTMSMGDSALHATLLGPAGLTFMGGEAAANEMQDIIARGGNNRQVLLGGLAAGIAEAAFEKYSLENFLKPKTINGWMDAVKVIAVQSGIEASEEVFTEIANILSDTAIMGRDSRAELAVRAYMLKDNKSEEEARKQLFFDQLGQVAAAGAGGLLSGVGMGSMSSAFNYAIGGGLYDAVEPMQYQNRTGWVDPSVQLKQEMYADTPQAAQTAWEGTAQGQKRTVFMGEAVKPRVTIADFTDVDSPIWNQVDFNDTQTRLAIQQDMHREMVEAGEVIRIPESTTARVGQSFPDLRQMKKSERTQILRQKMSELKASLRDFLRGLKGSNFEFEVNGNVLEATLYDVGIREVMEKVTQDKASMLFHSEDVFKNARYLYSTQDYGGDPNIYRWNYFYTPVQIGDEIAGVRIALRDMATPRESQIYNWGIKKDATLGDEGRGQDRISFGASSDASNNNIAQSGTAVKPTETELAQIGTPDLPAPLVELAEEMYADTPQEAQTAWEGDTQGFPAPLVELAQEMAEETTLLEQTAMERVELVQAQAAQTFGLRARAFGWNGQAALLEGWNGQQSTEWSKQDFYDGFALYYQAGLTGEDMGQVYNRYARALTAPQKQAAYRAGQQDAAMFAASGRDGAGRAESPAEDLGPSKEQAIPTKSDGQDDVLTSRQTDSILDTGRTSESATRLKIEQVKQAMTAQVKALPEKYRQALRRYTGSAAFRINSAIRSGKITPEIQREINLLDAALKDGVMPETVVLHRDTALSFLGLGLGEKPTAEDLSRIIGRNITNNIFTSTSFENLGLPGRNTQLWLTVPAGYRGCQFIQPVAHSKFKDQIEVLFARGLQYRITKATIENGKYVLYAEVLK